MAMIENVKKRRPQRVAIGCIACLLAIAISGCGSGNLGTVSGTVTLDGQPLEGAELLFMPTGGGGASVGTTDGSGKYTLQHVSRKAGAFIAQHKVSITTAKEIETAEGSDEDGEMEMTPEKLPPKYNSKTNLTADVKAGSNPIDFELTSE